MPNTGSTDRPCEWGEQRVQELAPTFPNVDVHVANAKYSLRPRGIIPSSPLSPTSFGVVVELEVDVQAQPIPILAWLPYRRGEQAFISVSQPRAGEVADVVCGDAKTCDVDLKSRCAPHSDLGGDSSRSPLRLRGRWRPGLGQLGNWGSTSMVDSSSGKRDSWDRMPTVDSPANGVTSTWFRSRSFLTVRPHPSTFKAKCCAGQFCKRSRQAVPLTFQSAKSRQKRILAVLDCTCHYYQICLYFVIVQIWARNKVTIQVRQSRATLY